MFGTLLFSQDSGETLTCAQCGESCRRDECVVDTKTLELMELYNSCTSDRKQGGGKLKLHLPSRLLGSKKDKKHDTKQEVNTNTRGKGSNYTCPNKESMR